MSDLTHKDLRSIQEARDLVEKAHQAALVMKSFSQEDVDRITESIAQAGYEASEKLAKMAVEDTGFGKWEDKVIKNQFATRNLIDYLRGMKTVGFIDEPGAVRRIAEPMGVVAGIIPSTNPTSTAMYKAIISLKSRNSIILSPHPSAADCIIEAANIMIEAAVKAGAPEHAITCMRYPDLAGTHELMGHRKVAIILATGGTGLVRSAYSSGKPAYGVGPGNCPSFIERSADTAKAVRDIVISKTFDNGTICASEQSIVVDRPVDEDVRQLLIEQKAYFCNDDERLKLESVMIVPSRGLNPKIVGQPAQKIAGMAGFTVPEDTSILVVEIGGVGRDYPLSIEKISPVICYYVVDGWEEGCEMCLKLINFGGIGHSMSIHTKDDNIVERFALEKPVMRILVNTPSTHGAIGYTTGLAPALTLGPGTWGGSVTAENITPMHLLNIKRLAYETNPLNGDDKDSTSNNSSAKWRYDDDFRYRPVSDVKDDGLSEGKKGGKVSKSIIAAPTSQTMKMISPDKKYGNGISESDVNKIVRNFRKS